MTVNYHDPVTDADVALKSNIVGGEHVPVHDINALPGTVESDIGGSKTFLQTLAGTVTSSRAAVNVDTVTTGKLDSIITALGSYLSTLAGSVSAGRVAIDVSTTIATYLSNLPTLAGAITSSRMAVNVDSTTTGKLDALHTDLSPGTPYIEQITSIPALGGTAAVFASHTFAKGESCFVRNCSTGGQIQYVTVSGTTPTATNGWPLAPGECTPSVDAANANIFKVLGSTSGGAAAVVGS